MDKNVHIEKRDRNCSYFLLLALALEGNTNMKSIISIHLHKWENSSMSWSTIFIYATESYKKMLLLVCKLAFWPKKMCYTKNTSNKAFKQTSSRMANSITLFFPATLTTIWKKLRPLEALCSEFNESSHMKMKI